MWRVLSACAVRFDRSVTPPAVHSPLQGTAPGVGKRVAFLILVHCLRAPSSYLYRLPNPALVFVVLSADDSGHVPVHNMIFSFAVVGYGWLVYFLLCLFLYCPRLSSFCPLLASFLVFLSPCAKTPPCLPDVWLIAWLAWYLIYDVAFGIVFYSALGCTNSWHRWHFVWSHRCVGVIFVHDSLNTLREYGSVTIALLSIQLLGFFLYLLFGTFFLDLSCSFLYCPLWVLAYF